MSKLINSTMVHKEIKEMMLSGLTLQEMSIALAKDLGHQYTPQWVSHRIHELYLMDANAQALREYWNYRKMIRKVQKYKTQLVDQVINKEIILE